MSQYINHWTEVRGESINEYGNIYRTENKLRPAVRSESSLTDNHERAASADTSLGATRAASVVSAKHLLINIFGMNRKELADNSHAIALTTDGYCFICQTESVVS
ncbi:jg2111 [Pararge aegeria aegeria]|uniref:Jg2111 protein n=2 Tax=Pararge aegeria TaxID=116150 RepID=A0A8S4S7U0_9NEOP|nr:jg2111 [Pararge aegeria aegeria]